jgi:hypothetical protein
LVVNSAALTNGKIAFADVTSFKFSVNSVTWDGLLTNTGFPVTIGNNGVPTSATLKLRAVYLSHGNTSTFTFDFNTNLTKPNLETWAVAGNVIGIQPGNGSGYWTLSVPEPDTATLGYIAIVTASALGLHRKLRACGRETSSIRGIGFAADKPIEP